MTGSSYPDLTSEKILENDKELVELFQLDDSELLEDDAVTKVRDFLQDVDKAVRTLRDKKEDIISNLSDDWSPVGEDIIREYFDKVDELVE